MNKNECKKLYIEYKHVCHLAHACKQLDHNNTIEQINVHIEELLEQQKNFNKCAKLRTEHGNACFGNIDNGHQIQINVIKSGLEKCNNAINKMELLIKHKLEQMAKSLKLIKKLKKTNI